MFFVYFLAVFLPAFLVALVAFLAVFLPPAFLATFLVVVFLATLGLEEETFLAILMIVFFGLGELGFFFVRKREERLLDFDIDLRIFLLVSPLFHVPNRFPILFSTKMKLKNKKLFEKIYFCLIK